MLIIGFSRLRQSLFQKFVTRRTRHKRRCCRTATPSIAAERLESRAMLSGVYSYPDLVATVGVYDENSQQANTVDAVADGSSMTHAEFTTQMADAWLDNNGAVLDGSGFGGQFGLGIDQQKVMHVMPDFGFGWEHQPLLTSPQPISGDGAFSTSAESLNSTTLWFGPEFGEQDESVVAFGLTVLGQNYDDYGTVYVIGHTARSEDVVVAHTVLEGTQDVFYGVEAPAGDYLLGLSIGYAPDPWVVDAPLYFDDLGFITGKPNGENNQAPTANDDFYETAPDTPLYVDAPGVLANDTDPDGHFLTTYTIGQPSHGSVWLQENGGFSFSPEPGFAGVATFTYALWDGAVSSNHATVTIVVGDANVPPIAEDDFYTLNEDEPLVVTDPQQGVLGNDVDAQDDPLSALLVDGPSHGTLTLHPDGTFSYAPDADYFGTDSFTYFVSDGTHESEIATVTLAINSVNDPPVAQNDAYHVSEDNPLVVPVAGLVQLTMSSEPGDYIGQGEQYLLTPDTGTFTVTRNFDNGVRLWYVSHTDSGDYWNLNFAAPGAVDLTAGHYAEATRFPFQADDEPGLSVSGQGRGSNTLTGEFTVHAVVYGPSGEVLHFDVTFEQHNEGHEPALTGHFQYTSPTFAGLLENDSDLEGDSLIAVLASNPSHGSVILGGDGHFVYTPDPDFHGTDSFTYQVSDGTDVSAPATMVINVLPVNDAPVANSQAVSTEEDIPLNGTVAGTDVDGDTLTYAVDVEPLHGTLVLNADGSFVYTPDADYHGGDSFSFVAHDGLAPSSAALVEITVAPVNDAPVANSQVVSTEEDVALSGTVAGTDVDGDALTYAVDAEPLHGTLVLNVDGSFIYTPDADFHGSDSFSFTAHDGLAPSSAALASITVLPLNDAPVANSQVVSTEEDVALSGTVAGTDVDGDTLTYAVDVEPLHGTLVLNADGSFIYTPDADFHGSDSFSFTAHDGTTASAAGNVSITVSPVNDAPEMSAATFVVAENSENGTLVGTVMASDVDGDSLTYEIVGGNTGGAFAIDPATGQITVANAAWLDFETTPEFVLIVQASDGSGGSVQAAVTVELTDVAEITPVSIDIVPGDSSNKIKSNGHDRVNVAILSTSSFNAQTVDIDSLRFGRTGTEDSLKRDGQGSPKYWWDDVNGDGLLDLVVEFDRDLLGFHQGDTQGFLTGQTLDGQSIAGNDDVTLQGNGWPN